PSERAGGSTDGGSSFNAAALSRQCSSHDRVGLADGPPLIPPLEPPGRRDGIAAAVENTATCQMIGIEPMFGVEARHSKAETRLDHAHLANRAVTYERDELRRLRVLAVHIAFAQKCARIVAGMDDGIRRVWREHHALV